MSHDCLFYDEAANREWVADCDTRYESLSVFNEGPAREGDYLFQDPEPTSGSNNFLDQVTDWAQGLPFTTIGLVALAVVVIIIVIGVVRSYRSRYCDTCGAEASAKDPFGHDICVDCAAELRGEPEGSLMATQRMEDVYGSSRGFVAYQANIEG